jgi:undecaprenyl-diphosphatase
MPVVLSAEVAPSRRTLIVALGVVVANLALFVLIAEDLVDGGGLISRDEAVLTWFLDHRTEWLVNASRVVSTFASFVSLLTIGVLFGAWLVWRRWPVALAAAPVVSLLAAGLASTVTKAAFDRPRPPAPVHAVAVSLAAFPSGHATDAAGFFVAASLVSAITVAKRRATQITCVVIGVLLVAIVGLSRLVLGVHWLSDVVAGWALGSAIAVATVVIFWYTSTRTPMWRDAP